MIVGTNIAVLRISHGAREYIFSESIAFGGCRKYDRNNNKTCREPRCTHSARSFGGRGRVLARRARRKPPERTQNARLLFTLCRKSRGPRDKGTALRSCGEYNFHLPPHRLVRNDRHRRFGADRNHRLHRVRVRRRGCIPPPQRRGGQGCLPCAARGACHRDTRRRCRCRRCRASRRGRIRACRRLYRCGHGKARSVRDDRREPRGRKAPCRAHGGRRDRTGARPGVAFVCAARLPCARPK